MITCYCNITYRCNNRCLFCAADPLVGTSDDISLSRFREILETCRIKAGDTVVLNGGEPTVHPDLFRFCREISLRGAATDLFTNGKKLADPDFLNRLLDIPTPMIVRIPVFGKSPETHDRLTGVNGNFNAVCAAIGALHEHGKKNLLVDIKLLFSKATLPENPGIFDRFRPELDDKRFQLSLNHLLISQQVIEHQNMFFLPYRELIDRSLNLLETVRRSGVNCRINMPVCLLPEQFRPRKQPAGAAPPSRRRVFYSDPKTICRETPREVHPACAGCTYIDRCSAFPASYLSFYGSSEISPITPDVSAV